MGRQLKIADGLSLPLEVVTEKMAFLGRTGGGKSYTAMKLAELMLGAGAQIIAIDPVGIWYGLRIGFSANIYIFGGLRGDFPLEPTGGVLMADLIVDKGISAVLDVSQFATETELHRFAIGFGQRFFFRKKSSPSAIHLFLEECQELLPQNPMGGEAAVLHEWTRLWKLGRNFGIGGSLISQRPQEVNKKALNMAGTLFSFQMTGPQERKTVEAWVQDKDIDEDIKQILPKLRVGEPHVWSPTFLGISKTVRILPKKSADTSSTPKVGSRAEEKPLTPVDIEKLQKQMAATIEKAKTEDPKELRRQVVDLRRQIATRPQKEVTELVEIPVLKDSQVEKLEKIFRKIVAEAERHGKALSLFWQNQSEVAEALLAAMRSVTKARPLVETNRYLRGTDGQRRLAQSVKSSTAIEKPSRRTAEEIRSNGPTDLGKCETAILSTLAQHGECDMGRLALLSGYRKSGGFKNSISKLRGLGYLDGSNTGVMRITEAGSKTEIFDALPTGRDLFQYWLNSPRMGTCEREIMKMLDGRRDGSTMEEIAENAGYALSGGFKNSLSKLRTAGIIVGRNMERMKLSEELM